MEQAVRDREAPPRTQSRWAPVFVAAGILLSRIAGLVRVRVFAHYFGLRSDPADAFNAAFRIPNLLQNLFGEGVLSASFIPVYTGLLARHEDEDAERVAGAVACLLALVTSIIVLVGVLAAPLLLDLIAPGFRGEKRLLTIRLVWILFPGAGILVLSAWCLGILNSHRRFFVSYTAPVAWNAAMIATLLGLGARLAQPRLAEALAWGSVAGSLLQCAVQVPTVLKVLGRWRLSLAIRLPGVERVVRSFVPVFISRGVVQISAYVDSLLASLLPTGAVTGLFNAQLLYTLPVSLFGMSVSAAELPAMSSAVGSADEVAAHLRGRLDQGLRQIAFFVVPSAAAFLAFGDVITGALFETGRFTHADSQYVWGILAGSTVGLLASTLGRLYSSTYYAMGDTRTPLRYAVLRVVLTTGLGWFCALRLPAMIGLMPRWGAAGLSASAGVAGWVEFVMLRSTLNQRIGRTGLPRAFLLQLWTAALAAAAVSAAARRVSAAAGPIQQALLVCAAFGLTYVGLTLAFRIEEAHVVTRKLRRLASSRTTQR